MSFNAEELVQGKSAGTVGISQSGIACIAVYMYDELIWQPVSKISSARWIKIRSDVQQSLNQQMVDNETMTNFRNAQRIADETPQLIQNMFTLLPMDKRQSFLENNEGSIIDKICCRACLKIADCPKAFCIHHNCCGMCQECWDRFDNEENQDCCPACHQKQNVMCPICQENKNHDELIKAHGGCGHYVCWSCYGKAYHSGRPIIKCPMCRGTFAKPSLVEEKQLDTPYEYYDSDDTDMSEFDIDDDTGRSRELTTDAIIANITNFIENFTSTTISTATPTETTQLVSHQASIHDANTQTATELATDIISLLN